MVTIPTRFSSELLKVIEWHLRTYMPEKYFNAHLEQILERFFERNLVAGQVQIEESFLYEINECISNATTNITECDVEKDVIWDLYDWVVAERKRLSK